MKTILKELNELEMMMLDKCKIKDFAVSRSLRDKALNFTVFAHNKIIIDQNFYSFWSDEENNALLKGLKEKIKAL